MALGHIEYDIEQLKRISRELDALESDEIGIHGVLRMIEIEEEMKNATHPNEYEELIEELYEITGYDQWKEVLEFFEEKREYNGECHHCSDDMLKFVECENGHKYCSIDCLREDY